MIQEVVDAKSTYGKGVLGRIRATLDNNILPLVGGEFDGKVAKFQHFAPGLPPYPFEPHSIELEAARLNVRLPKVLDAMLLSGNRTLRDGAYIEALGGEDFTDIAKIAMKTVLVGPQDPKTVLRVVYGGTKEMPLRGLSYLLPPLCYMEGLKDAGVAVPQLQAVFADHISSEANSHLTLEEATRESDHFARLAREYIKYFFPKLADSVVMLRDTPIGPGSPIETELEVVIPIADQVVSQKMRQELLKKSNGNRESSVYYGAAHLLAHDVFISGAFLPIFDEQPNMIEPEAIISFGGRQERFFYRLRNEIKPHLPERYKRLLTAQFFTRHQVPPYYMASDGDLSLVEYLNSGFAESSLGSATVYDLAYLRKVGLPDREGVAL